MRTSFSNTSVLLPLVATVVSTLILCVILQADKVTAVARDAQLKLLVFSKTNAFRHITAIEAGKAMFQKFETDYNYKVTLSEDTEAEFGDNITPTILANKYDVIVLLHNTGPDLWWTDKQKANFMSFVEANSKGIVGIHAASDGSNWNWYINSLIGASFTKHPPPSDAVMTIEKPNHFIMNGMYQLLGNVTTWKRYDEWYEFNRNVRTQAPELVDVEILATVDESTYVGGGMGPDHVLIWIHDMKNHPANQLPTRVFYTALGHPDSSYTDPIYISHIVRGVEWVARRDPDSPATPSPSPLPSPSTSTSPKPSTSTSNDTHPSTSTSTPEHSHKIGRASCRERVL